MMPRDLKPEVYSEVIYVFICVFCVDQCHGICGRLRNCELDCELVIPFALCRYVSKRCSSMFLFCFFIVFYQMPLVGTASNILFSETPCLLTGYKTNPQLYAKDLPVGFHFWACAHLPHPAVAWTFHSITSLFLLALSSFYRPPLACVFVLAPEEQRD